jgi:membrane protease YdiL (CAAX protease family)
LQKKSIKFTKEFDLSSFGINYKNIDKSIKLGFLFIPIMLFITFSVKYMIGASYDANFSLGIVSFIESFTEEFFFRGVLFLFLLNKTNLKIAYVTSFLSFVLMHPQNFNNLFIFSTIVQGIITLEICKKTSNLTGSWIVHGTNRFFSIAIYPLLVHI